MAALKSLSHLELRNCLCWESLGDLSGEEVVFIQGELVWKGLQVQPEIPTAGAEAGCRGSLPEAFSQSVPSLCHASLTTPQAFQGVPPAGSRMYRRSGNWHTGEGFQIDNEESKKSDDGNASCTPHFPSRTWAEEEEGCLHEGSAYLDEDVITMLGHLAPEPTCPPALLRPPLTCPQVPHPHGSEMDTPPCPVQWCQGWAALLGPFGVPIL